MESIFDKSGFLQLLEKFISLTPQLQNNPPEFIPKESLVGDIIMEKLQKFSVENGGSLSIEKVGYVHDRYNIIIKYAGLSDKYVGFIGSHMDVVPANPNEWKRNPFVLTVEGDYLYGRGTTDCLGHVALMVQLFEHLAIQKPVLNCGVACVLIVDEEFGSEADIGISRLQKENKLDFLKGGLVYWLDSADIFPTIGCCSLAEWKLTVTGKQAHSGMPQNGINPILLATQLIDVMLINFHTEFPEHSLETEYGFQCSSTMKPTKMNTSPGSTNQIPNEVTMYGDIRGTPFYSIHKMIGYVNDLVSQFDSDPQCFVLQHDAYKNVLGDGTKASMKIEWINEIYEGIACNINSIGFKLMSESIKEVMGSMKTSSIGGSLPLVADLVKNGLDVQLIGFGKSEVYHGENEHCKLSDMEKGYNIITKIINKFHNYTVPQISDIEIITGFNDAVDQYDLVKSSKLWKKATDIGIEKQIAAIIKDKITMIRKRISHLKEQSIKFIESNPSKLEEMDRTLRFLSSLPTN